VYTVAGKSIDRLIWQAGILVKYSMSHAARCMSFGVWDGSKCRVDVLIVPLLRVAFQDATDVLKLETPFDTLRRECPAAFGADRADALNRFQSTFALLTEPYAPVNELVAYNPASCERMTDKSVYCVAYTINKLAESIFGLQQEKRSIADLGSYKLRARCAAHVFRQLQRVQLDNAQKMGQLDVSRRTRPAPRSTCFQATFPSKCRSRGLSSAFCLRRRRRAVRRRTGST
jgi:hypothetical protein